MNEQTIESAPLAVSNVTPLAPREAAAVPAFFGHMRPAEKIAYATEVADALKPILQAKKLVHRLNRQNPEDEYVELEGWQTCGNLCGVTAKIEWSRPLADGRGWEARAIVVRVENGVEVGSGESLCTRDEQKWAKAGEYAVRGMAQTRAQSRALRGVLAWILVLAGYKATPAEEMPPAAQDGPKTTFREPPSPVSTQTATFVPSWDSLRARWAAATGFDPGEFKATLGGRNRSEVLATVEALEAQKAAAPAPAQAQPAISAERIRLHAYAKTISDERYRAIMSLEYGVESSSQLHDGHVRPLADLLASLCSDAVRERVEADLAAGLEAWKQRQSPPPAADNDDEPNFDFAIGAGA